MNESPQPENTNSYEVVWESLSTHGNAFILEALTFGGVSQQTQKEYNLQAAIDELAEIEAIGEIQGNDPYTLTETFKNFAIRKIFFPRSNS
jgi:hypothetical protein